MDSIVILEISKDDLVDEVINSIDGNFESEEHKNKVYDEVYALVDNNFLKRVKDEFHKFFCFDDFREIRNEIIEEFADEIINNNNFV